MLISHSPDLQRLGDEGYEVELRQSTTPYLLISGVPYVNPKREVARGTLVSPLQVNGDVTASPIQNHQCWFIGDHPCKEDGTPIPGIVHGSAVTDFGDGIVVQHSFSAKPLNQIPYKNYHEKMTRYIDIISAPAEFFQPGITAKTFNKIAEPPDDSVFEYADSASSRSGIGAISEKLKLGKVAIVGLGGTGSYILDHVAKTHVREIHLFDGDQFSQHNAFRSPGAPARSELTNPMKVDYFKGIYSRMRRGIFAHPTRVDDSNLHLLDGYDFVFICIDNGVSRKTLVGFLQAREIPFVDTGLDVFKTSDGGLGSVLHTTLSAPGKTSHIPSRLSFSDVQRNDIYVSNIQVAELNALNAVFAVIKWKKFCGFYRDDIKEYNSLYTSSTHSLVKNDTP